MPRGSYKVPKSEARVHTTPFVLTTLAFFCFFSNINAFNS